MANYRTEMRLTGTKEDLNKWLWFMEKLQEKQIVRILDKSEPYKNRGESEMYRVYIKAEYIYADD